VKWGNPFLVTLKWMLLGCIVGLIQYLGHLLLLHQEESEVDDHSRDSARTNSAS